MQISAANGSAAFGSRASKFLVTNRTLSYSAEVSGTREIWYQNAWHTNNVTGTSFWYQKLGRRTWVVCHGPCEETLVNLLKEQITEEEEIRHKIVL